jgi:hypothetical protein
MRSKPHEREVTMPTKAESAHEAALDVLAEILKDSSVKIEVRVEAAKLILNRPRFFVGSDIKEA